MVVNINHLDPSNITTFMRTALSKHNFNGHQVPHGGIKENT